MAGTRSTGAAAAAVHKFSQRYAASSDTEEWNRVCGMAAATTFRHHRRRHGRARPACTHTACFRLPALNSGGGHCIYILHTETANKRGADLNNVSSNSVLARCDVAPLPSSPLLLPIYAYPSLSGRSYHRFQKEKTMNSYIMYS